MDLKEFLQKSATPALVESVRQAMYKADQTQRQTYLAHLVDTVLDDESVRNRLNSEIRLKAKAALAEQLAPYPQVSSEKSATFAFDLNALTAPAIALARDWGAEKVSPLTLLATCLSPQLLKEVESAQTQEALRTAGLTVDAMVPQRGQKDSAMRADFTFKSLGFGTDVTAMARSGVWTSCP